MRVPRLILAAPMSGSGKTTITTALIAAFRARGLRIAPFKVGPDYIDPTYLSLAAGRAARNLDAWMLPPERIVELFARATQDADLALTEGVMGLFDGFSGGDDTGSTAHVARILDTPVLLVLDVSAMARTAAAIVKGVRDFDPRTRIAGVILNRVGSEGHAQMVRDAIESTIGVPVIGYLARDDALNLPERHLGLIPTLELMQQLDKRLFRREKNGLESAVGGKGQVDALPGRWNAWLDTAREKISMTVDLDRVMDLARAADLLPFTPPPSVMEEGMRVRATIAVARDAAFNFLYEDNLDLLRDAGAEITFFSPLNDRALPRGTQAIYLCGGFPEIYAAELSANERMRAEIRAAHRAQMPIYAECGGLMYLTEEIVNTEGQSHSMVGILPGRSVMSEKLTLGYRELRAVSDSWLWRAGETIRGHEFHYSTWENRPSHLMPAYELLPGATPTLPSPVSRGRVRVGVEGACIGNLFASYVHLHLLARPELVERFVSTAARRT